MIKELEKKLHSEYQVNIQSGEQYTVNLSDLECIKRPLESQHEPPFGPMTRSITNQQQHNADILVGKDNNPISFKVQVEGEKNETNDEVEYILDYNPNDTDAESFKSDTFGAKYPTCYELSDQTNGDSNELDESKQNIGIVNVMSIEINCIKLIYFLLFPQFAQFTEYLDENYEDLSSNNLLLESLLPAIKASVAQKSGTLLDEKTQYNIVGTSTEEMRVQCITSDGKEFEIEMVLDPTHETQALTVKLLNRN